MATTGSLLNREFTLASLKAASLRFCAWESDGFRSILPPSALAWLMKRGARVAVVRAGASELVLAAETGRPEIRISGAEIKAASLDAALARRGLSRKAVVVVLELPSSAFLTRQFEAPAAALSHLPQMIDAEIGRKTPFRRDEVLLGHQLASHSVKGKATVRMALLRRDLVTPALDPSGLALADLAAIRAEAEPAGSGQMPTIPVGDGGVAHRIFPRVALAMTLTGALLVGAGVGGAFWRQYREGADLDARLAEMSARAARVRQIADRASKESRLLSLLHETRRRNARLTELWEEVSRLLPDSAYLTDFRLSESKSGERSVELAGFAQSAVSLPLLFDQSKYFTEAALTAPITSVPNEKRESFSLRMMTRAAQKVVTSGSGAAGNGRPPSAEPRQ